MPETILDLIRHVYFDHVSWQQDYTKSIFLIAFSLIRVPITLSMLILDSRINNISNQMYSWFQKKVQREGIYISAVVFFWSIEYLLEMSSSWNFPARASPSYEGSEPRQAKLGHFNFRAETELIFFKALIKNYNQISQFSTSIMIITNSNQFYKHLYEFMEDKRCFRKLKTMI
jgi:hypothetical protein